MKTPSTLAALPLAALSLGVLTLAGCGAGKAARPADPTYAKAVGADGPAAVCHDVTAAGDPLVVDWKPEDRADLEVALKKGVAVVHYDCQSIKLLPDCVAQGKYGYAGVTKKEQLISLVNADEAKANLPFNGGSLGGGLAQGAELDIALAIIGKRSTTFADLPRAALHGKCEGATHFVRAATVGAFAMTTATSGEVKVAADLFGVGAGASSSSKKSVTNRDGDAASCDKADPDAPKPPGQCGALLRLQLIAIASQDSGARPAPPPTDLVCPAGMVPSRGKCAVATDDRAKQCHGGKLEACESLCDAGDVDTCVFWAQALMKKTVDEKTSAYDAKAVKGLQKACDAGRAESCAFLGNYIWDGHGVAKNPALGRDLNAKACAAGSGAGCASIGNSFLHGDGLPVDKPRGLAFVARACSLGSGAGCVIAGQALNGGFGKDLPVDRARATDFFERGCDAREPGGCFNAGVSYEHGDGVPANRAAAAGYFQQACRLGMADGCARAKKIGK